MHRKIKARTVTGIALLLFGLLVGLFGNEYLLSSASASDAKYGVVSVTATGISAAALSGGVTSSAIDFGSPWGASEMAWHAAVTVGTTTDVQVTCEESPDNVTWYHICFCSGSATSICQQQKLSFDVTATANFSVAWKPRTRYMRCSFEDLAAGTGTITVVGSRVSL